jgi:hypothetical protein
MLCGEEEEVVVEEEGEEGSGRGGWWGDDATCESFLKSAKTLNGFAQTRQTRTVTHSAPIILHRDVVRFRGIYLLGWAPRAARFRRSSRASVYQKAAVIGSTSTSTTTSFTASKQPSEEDFVWRFALGKRQQSAML